MSLGDFLSVLALAISLVSIVLSVRYTVRGSKASAYDRATDLFLEIDRIFIEHPEMRAYFYGNEKVPAGDPVVQRVEATAELILDVFEWVWRRQEELVQRDQEGWCTYILDSLRGSSALLDFHQLHTSWHPAIESLLMREIEIKQPYSTEVP
jgi:hypothetical protein